jgi:hypothetical protein
MHGSRIDASGPTQTTHLFAMPGFGPASAPVANCGVLGFLGALNSYPGESLNG